MSEEEIEKLTDERLRTEEFKRKQEKENKQFENKKVDEDEEEDDDEAEEKVQMSTYSMLVALQQEQIESRVVSMQSQIKLLDQMEKDMEAIDKELDPFQSQLLSVAEKLGIDEAQVEERKVEILSSLIDEIKTEFKDLTKK
uniref:Uncharacterized protein n=1 Tax=Ditylenchus dipsaci TaxID=166011 RepID=A0A915EB76_9BILA